MKWALRTIFLLFAYRGLRLQHSSFLLWQSTHTALRWNPLQHLRFFENRWVLILRRRTYFILNLDLPWLLVIVLQLDLKFRILRAFLSHRSRHARGPFTRYYFLLNTGPQLLRIISTGNPLLSFYHNHDLTLSRRRWLNCQWSQSLLVSSKHDPLILILLPIYLHQLVKIAPWLV